MAAIKEKLRIRLKSYDHTLIDTAAEKIVETAKRNGATVSGPVPLPTDREIVTILRAVHKYKDSREQFEMRTHKRLSLYLWTARRMVTISFSVGSGIGPDTRAPVRFAVSTIFSAAVSTSWAS